MIIDYKMLEFETLRAVIESFIQREGTDYGFELSLEEKTNQILLQLQQGRAVLSFDAESETINILSSDEAKVLHE